jgi:DNA polymerase sigma
MLQVNSRRQVSTNNNLRSFEELMSLGYSTELLRHTYIPLIKLEVRGFGLARSVPVDISWGNSIGIYKTTLLSAYSNVDSRVRLLVLFIKHWSKMRKLTDTRRGGMGSFAWCLLCIHFLMKVAKPPVVPNLQAMPGDEKYIQGCDVGFSKAITFSDNWSRNTQVFLSEGYTNRGRSCRR